jgi:cysteine desulfurase
MSSAIGVRVERWRGPPVSLALAELAAYAGSSTMNRVYLDHNATTPVDPEVLAAMLPYFSGEYGNASSIHTFGQKARSAVETAREHVAALMGARPQEIIFTSGGTEADNHAIFGIAEAAAAYAGAPATSGGGAAFSYPHIITTAIEHEAVLNTCQALEKRGLSVTYLPVDREGQIDLEALRHLLPAHPETTLITVMHANNELGAIQPLEEIGRIAATADVYFHTDAVQSAGKIPIDVNALNLDLLSLSGHKLYAPKGIGALYIRGGTRLRQLLYGGHHQRGFRPGTENVAGIVGLGKAAQIAKATLAEDAKRVAGLRDTLEHSLVQRVSDARVNGAGAPRTPNTANITFPGIEGEALVIALDLKGLACSTGAACSSGAVEPSHVLTAIGLPAEEARASLRFSLGRHTTAADIDFALQVVPAAVAQLRELSPNYRKEAEAEAR